MSIIGKTKLTTNDFKAQIKCTQCRVVLSILNLIVHKLVYDFYCKVLGSIMHLLSIYLSCEFLSVIKASLGWPAQRRLCTLMNMIR